MEFRKISADLSSFLAATLDHRIMGLNCLAMLILEMNNPAPSKNFNRHRRTNVDFRDFELLRSCEIAFTTVRDLVHNPVPYENAEQGKRHRDASIDLLLNCLTYDFLGGSSDDPSEETGALQIPPSWRTLLEHENHIASVWEVYSALEDHRTKVLTCLVQLASTRRGLFISNETRASFLQCMLTGCTQVLSQAEGLADNPDNFHQMARLLSKVVTVFALEDLLQVGSTFDNWLSQAAQFSKKALNSWDWSPNSIPYVLTVWSKLGVLIKTFSGRSERILGGMSAVSAEFISSRMAAVETIENEGVMDDPLDDETSLLETLALFTTFARQTYPEVKKALDTYFNPLAAGLTSIIERLQQLGENSLSEQDSSRKRIIENKFAWLVYIVGSLIGGRTSYTRDEMDEWDGKAIGKVLQLMAAYNKISDARCGSERLELALVYFIKQFKNNLIGDQGARAHRVYAHLSEVTGHKDQNEILEHFLEKMMNNLNKWAATDNVVNATVQAISELGSGYMTIRRLRNSSEIQSLLSNHAEFAFLRNDSSFKPRLLFYQTLGRIVISEETTEDQFLEFVAPWTAQLNEMQKYRDRNILRANGEIAKRVPGLFRDLRGFASSLLTKRHYQMFLDWLGPFVGLQARPVLSEAYLWLTNSDPTYPQEMSVPLKLLNAFMDNVSLTNSILKFQCELVTNKSARLSFEGSNVDGLLLFRETSKLLVTYGRYLLEYSGKEADFILKYKGIRQCYRILRWTIAGAYVNFGVFRIYGDQALQVCLQTVYDLFVRFQTTTVLSYPKLRTAFFDLVDMLTATLINEIAETMPIEVYKVITQALSQGVRSFDDAVQAQCASAIDNICTYLINKRQRREPQETSLMKFATELPQAMPYLMVSLLHTVLFEESSVQWSLSRPLLGLILLYGEFYKRYTEALVFAQLPEKQEVLRSALALLMVDIEPNLHARNRDKFTQNMTALRRKVLAEELVLRAPTSDVIQAVSEGGADLMNAEQITDLLSEMKTMTVD